MVAVNRVGSGGGIVYDGGSVAWDPWGERVAGTTSPGGIRLVDLDPKRVADVRRQYPFLADLQA